MEGKINVVQNAPGATLGEGAIWHCNENVLYWIDITGKKLHRYDPGKSQNSTFNMGSMIGTVVPAIGKFVVLVALETGIWAMEQNGQLIQLTQYPPEMDNNRFNDGKCDPQGRFWVGTMNKDVIKGAGNLYLYEDLKLIRKQSDITISNGIAWSADGKTMYYIDTPEYAVFAYDYDPETGNLSNRRKAVNVSQSLGAPDGMTIDSEGLLWVAHWGGGAVIQWDPENGIPIQKVEVPAPNVTSCAFGDKDMKTLYITTAREGLSEKKIKEHPLSGRLFKIQPGDRGVKAGVFKS
ncbi:SMP-30/gluconolactonase/LRE family protein [Marinilabilia rubra]|nr:SMP-30/gluconolactonase/LRE family protein [Marinilabilia rubra]